MKKISKILVILSVFALVLSLNTYANQKTYLVVNGEYIKTDVDPFIENGRTLVPIRFISENLDCKVDWNQKEKIATITDEKEGAEVKKVELTIGSDIAKLYDKEDNAKEEKLDVAAKVVNGRTFVPVRFISEALGTEVGWDKENRVVLIGDASKYDAKKFKEEVIDKEAPVKKEEKIDSRFDKDGKLILTGYEGAYSCSYMQCNIYILKNEMQNQIKSDYIAKVECIDPDTNEDIDFGYMFITLGKDGKTGVINGQKVSKDTPIKFDGNRLILLDGYWYKLGVEDILERKGGKAYLNGKEVQVEPGK